MAQKDNWTADKVRRVITNPIYAGVGPFYQWIDGIKVEIPSYPAIIDDDAYVKVQSYAVIEDGAYKVLRTMRQELTDSIGVKIADIYSKGWLENSVSEIKLVGTERFFRKLLTSLRPTKGSLELIDNKVHVTDVTASIIKTLSDNPEEFYRISPETFELFVCERMDKMGFEVKQVGGTFHKDGGVDIVAWPKPELSTFPFLVAVQVKHHKSATRKTGPRDVRDLLGVTQAHQFNVGVLVTNTTFTPDARWFAEKRSSLIRLRDMDDIQQWLKGKFLNEFEWSELPEELEVCPGVVVKIPKAFRK